MGCGVGFGRGENQVVDKSIALPSLLLRTWRGTGISKKLESSRMQP
jgi:hypothetical protein